MTRNKQNSALLLLCAGLACTLLAQFCIKPPDYPIEPKIEFKRLSKNVMKQKAFGPDSVSITFSFTDGNGDLGFEDNESSIFLVDTRDNVEKTPYALPFLGLQGVGNGISGEVSIVFANSLTCCVYPFETGYLPCDTLPRVPQARDTVSFKIRIKDRAGNFSNEIETAPIYLICKRQ